MKGVGGATPRKTQGSSRILGEGGVGHAGSWQVCSKAEEVRNYAREKLAFPEEIQKHVGLGQSWARGNSANGKVVAGTR